jgi:hypothetical protein
MRLAAGGRSLERTCLQPTPKAGGKNQNNPMRQLDEALRQLKTDREREADSGGFGVAPGVGEKAPRSERREI